MSTDSFEQFRHFQDILSSYGTEEMHCESLMDFRAQAGNSSQQFLSAPEAEK